MALDLADRHAARVHRHDLLVEAGKPALIAGNQLRIERAFAITRNAQIQLGAPGQHRLLRIAITMIGFARRCLAIEMLVELRIQNTLSQRLLQFVKQTVLGKDLLGIASRKQLVQRTLLDCHSSPPPASLWPCTQDF